MAQLTITEIGMNDTLDNVIRKCNDNFRRISFASDRKTRSGIRQESVKTNESINEAVGTLRADIDKDIAELAKDHTAFKNRLESIESSLGIVSSACPFMPGFVITLIDDTDPNEVWPGTVWQKIEGKRFLLTAENDDQLGNKGGEAEHKLTTDEMPIHSHTHSHTHQIGAHTHGLNGHTHTVGAHAHGLNSHTHSVGAHAHGLNNHTHSMSHAHSQRGFKNTGREAANYGAQSGGGFGNRLLIDTNATDQAMTIKGNVYTGGTDTANTGAASGNTANSNAFNSGAASGNTANSAEFNTGGNSGNTTNNSAFDSGEASSTSTSNTGGDAAHNNMPPYLVVNMWKRVS